MAAAKSQAGRRGGRYSAWPDGEWRRAHILIRCNDESHKGGSCRAIRDALIDNFRLVSEASLAIPTKSNGRVCVMATADVRPEYESYLRRGIKNMRCGSRKSARVDRLEMYITA